MRTPSTYLLLITLLLLLGCTEEQRSHARRAERDYVDLLRTVHQDDQAASIAAVNRLSLSVRELRRHWYRPLDEEQSDNQFYHLDMAAWAFADCEASILEGELDLAAVQLDRATYELQAADPEVFRELYVGSIYDFVSNWLEVNYAIHDSDLCQLEWTDFGQYARNVRIGWRGVRHERPTTVMYPPQSLDRVAFAAAHGRLTEELDRFLDVLQLGDQCRAQEQARVVSQTLWDLLAVFGSPVAVG